MNYCNSASICLLHNHVNISIAAQNTLGLNVDNIQTFKMTLVVGILWFQKKYAKKGELSKRVRSVVAQNPGQCMLVAENGI